jgi:Ca2+-transporting ATPase
MITGDSIHTAKAIATKAGILEPGFICLDGNELDTFSDKELEKIIPKVRVFARVNPEQKYRIVNTLMKLGEVVAVTGDGVNDAPALKKADIGIAMGITGTDVSKEVSDMILTDDNFASIVSAIKYGRAIFDNIKSFVRYQISTNVAALTLMFSAPVLNLPLPLNPIQILWINIMVDGPPALALGVEPPSGDVMKRPPRNPKISFVTQNLIVSILVIGVLMAFIAIALFGFYLFYNPDKANSAVFTLFVFLQLFNALNCRSNTKSIFSNFFSNKSIFFAIMFSLIIHLSIIYIPFLQSIFKTIPLEMEDFSLIIPTAFAIIVFEEIRKKFLPKTTNY